MLNTIDNTLEHSLIRRLAINGIICSYIVNRNMQIPKQNQKLTENFLFYIKAPPTLTNTDVYTELCSFVNALL